MHNTILPKEIKRKENNLKFADTQNAQGNDVHAFEQHINPEKNPDFDITGLFQVLASRKHPENTLDYRLETGALEGSNGIVNKIADKKNKIKELKADYDEETKDEIKKEIKEEIGKEEEEKKELETNRDQHMHEITTKMFRVLHDKQDKNGIVVNSRDDKGKLPLEVAIENKNLLAIRELIKAGARTSITFKNDGENAKEVGNAFSYVIEHYKQTPADQEEQKKNIQDTLWALAGGSAALKLTVKAKTTTQGDGNTKTLEAGTKKTANIVKALSAYAWELRDNYEKTFDTLQKCDQNGENFFHTVIKSQNKEVIEWLDLFLAGNLEERVNDAFEVYTTSTGITEEDKIKIEKQTKKEIQNQSKQSKELIEKKTATLISMPDASGRDSIEYIAEYAKGDFLDVLSKTEIFQTISCSGDYKRNIAKCLMYNNFDFASQIAKSSNTIEPGENDNRELTIIKAIEIFVDEYGNSKSNNSEYIASKFITNSNVLEKLVSSFDEEKEDSFLSALLQNDKINPSDIIYLAVKLGKSGPVKEIFKKSKNFDLTKLENAEGLNPLEIAIKTGKNYVAQTILESVSADLITKLIATSDEKTGGNLLHLAAEHAPDLAEKILGKLTADQQKQMLAQQNKNKETPGQIAAQNPKANQETFGNGTDEKKLYNAAANGDIKALEKLFDADEKRIYQTFKYQGESDSKSILEIAAENGKGNIVRFIIARHNKLQQELKSLNGEIEQLTKDINNFPINIVGDDQIKKQFQEIQKKEKKDRKAEVETSLNALKSQIQTTAIKVLPKQKEEQWHKDVLDAAQLIQQVIQTYLDKRGPIRSNPFLDEDKAQEKVNPLLEALENTNSLVADTIYSAHNELINEVRANGETIAGERSPSDLLIENGNIDKLLEYGQSAAGVYDRPYKFNPSTKPTEKDSSTKKNIADLFKDNLEPYRKPLKEPLSGKGILTVYANALNNDDAKSSNFKQILSDHIKDDKNTSFLNLKGNDGNTLGTLTAAFGFIEQWKLYENKYSALASANKPALYACNDPTSPLGTPAQAALLAKELATNDQDKLAREQLFDYFLSNGLDICQPNLDGENLLHTIAKCSNFEALSRLLDIYDPKTISKAIIKQNNDEKTSIQIAIEQGVGNFPQALIQNLMYKIPPQNFRTTLLSGNLLHTAVLHENTAVIRLLLAIQQKLNLDLGSKLHLENQPDKEERNPFELAVSVGNLEAINVFAENNIIPEKERIKNFIEKEASNIKPEVLDRVFEVYQFNNNEEQIIKNKIQQKDQEPKQDIIIEVPKEDKEKIENIEKECTKAEENDQDKFKKESKYYAKKQTEQDKRFANSQTILKKAILNGEIGKAIKIIQNEPDILVSKFDQELPIDLILETGYVELIKIAAEYYNHQLSDNAGNTFLHKIIQKYPDKQDLIQVCISNGASLLQKNNQSKSPPDILLGTQINSQILLLSELQKQQQAEKDNIISALLRCTASITPEERDIERLATAMKNSNVNVQVFGELFSICFDPADASDSGRTAKNKVELVNKLIRKDVPLTETDNNGNNILHQFFQNLAFSKASENISQYVLPVVQSILESKSFSPSLLFAKNQNGVTPLEYLAQADNVSDIWECLTSHARANEFVNKVDISSLFMLAASSGKEWTCQFLLKNYYNRIDINSTDEHGDSPLLSTVTQGNKSMIELLLKNGADINQCDKHGRNVASRMLDKMLEDYTRGKRDINLDILHLLVEHGIDINHKDNQGLSLLYRCAKIDILNQKREQRYNDLLKKETLTNNQTEEKELLQGIISSDKFLEVIKKAQEDREKDQTEIKNEVHKALFKTPGGKIKSFLYDAAASKLPEFINGKIININQNDFSIHYVGGLLNVEVTKSANVNIEGLFNLNRKVGNVCTNKVELSFNCGKDKATVQKHPSGVMNYEVKNGSIVINTTVKIDDKPQKISVEVYANGKVEFIGKSAESMKEKLNKLDFAECKIYVGGTKLEQVLKTGKWKEGVQSAEQTKTKKNPEQCLSGQANNPDVDPENIKKELKETLTTDQIKEILGKKETKRILDKYNIDTQTKPNADQQSEALASKLTNQEEMKKIIEDLKQGCTATPPDSQNAELPVNTPQQEGAPATRPRSNSI